MKYEVQELSNDLNVITSEINAYKRIAGEAVFEIGKRLKHVKENDLVHGEWNTWCQNELGFTRQYANRFVKIYEELGANGNPSFHSLSAKALYQIATLPEEERQKKHTTSKGEEKTPDEMTVKELRELKKQLKEERQRREEAEKEHEDLQESNEQLARRLMDEDSKEPEREVVVEPDPQTEEELRRYKDKYGTLYDNGDTLSKVKSKEEREADYERIIAKMGDMRRELASIQYEGKQFGEWVSEDQERIDEVGAFEKSFEDFSKSIVSESTIINL